jgi:hypothetical protein
MYAASKFPGTRRFHEILYISNTLRRPNYFIIIILFALMNHTYNWDRFTQIDFEWETSLPWNKLMGCLSYKLDSTIPIMKINNNVCHIS